MISENAQTGKISPKTHKNTPEVSQFFKLHNRQYFISHTKSYNAFKFSTVACNLIPLELKGHRSASN